MLRLCRLGGRWVAGVLSGNELRCLEIDCACLPGYGGGDREECSC